MIVYKRCQHIFEEEKLMDEQVTDLSKEEKVDI